MSKRVSGSPPPPPSWSCLISIRGVCSNSRPPRDYLFVYVPPLFFKQPKEPINPKY